MASNEKKELKEQLQELLDKGICEDVYRLPSIQTSNIKNKYLCQEIDDLFDKLGAQIFSKTELRSRYQ